MIRTEKHPPQKMLCRVDINEVLCITVALLSLTAALTSGKLSEEQYSTLMAAFLGYTFGRIFNHRQGKE